MSPKPASEPTSVRPLDAAEWRTYRALRLRALADSPDAFSRTLADEEGRADAEWSRMLAAAASSPSEISLVAERAGRAVGLAYGRLDPGTAEIAHLYSMWVDPSARRLGVGLALVEAVAAWARSRSARSLVLQVTEGNVPATRLYQGAGFVATSERSPLRPGSSLYARTLRLVL